LISSICGYFNKRNQSERFKGMRWHYELFFFSQTMTSLIVFPVPQRYRKRGPAMRGTDRIGLRWILFLIVAAACSLAAIHTASAAVQVTATAGPLQPAVPAAVPAPIPAIAPAAIEVAPELPDVRIGPSHILYGLKLSLENLDESFAPSAPVKMEKQLEHANIRIAEVRTELQSNRSEGAQTALRYYQEKITTTTAAVPALPPDETVLLQAQKEAAAHQVVLGQLLTTHMDNQNLIDAHADSVALEAAFSGKTGYVIKEQVLPDNRVMLQAVKLEGTGTPVSQQTPQTPAVPATTTTLPTQKPSPLQTTSHQQLTPQPTPTPAIPSPQITSSPAPVRTPSPAPQTTTTPTPEPTINPTPQPTPSPASQTTTTPTPEPTKNPTPQPTPSPAPGQGNLGTTK
jgi:hypothetical protein